MKGSTQAPHLHAANLFYFTILSRCHSSHVHANDYNMHLDVALNTIIHAKIYNHSSECSINSMPHETKTMHRDPTTTQRHTAMHIYCQGYLLSFFNNGNIHRFTIIKAGCLPITQNQKWALRSPSFPLVTPPGTIALSQTPLKQTLTANIL